MTDASRSLSWATHLYRGALLLAFMLSAMLLSAGISFGFFGFDLTSLWSWWAIFLILNPFAGLGLRHFYPATFDNARNLQFSDW
jgi:hypothetical protein